MAIRVPASSGQAATGRAPLSSHPDTFAAAAGKDSISRCGGKVYLRLLAATLLCCNSISHARCANTQ